MVVSRARRLFLGSVFAALAAAALHPSRSSAQPAAGRAASISLDVDGDGVAEELSTEGGALLARGAKRSWRAALGGAPIMATARAQNVGDARLLAVQLTTADGHAMWVGRVVALPAPKLEPIATLPLGPQGPDGEYTAHAELGAAGLLRWQARADLRGCDGAALRALAETWDARTARWVAAPSWPSAPQGLEVAASSAGAPAASKGASDVFRPRLVTSLAGATRADELAAPTELSDGDPRTAWRTAEGWDGRGEAVGFRARLAAGKALRIRVVPGDARSLSDLRTWARPAKLAILGGKQPVLVSLPDPVAARAAVELAITLPEPIEGCLTVVVVDVHPGARRAMAVSELVIETDYEGHSAGGTAALASAVARGGLEGQRAEGILAQRGAAAAQGLLAELGVTREPVAKARLVRALTKLTTPEIEAPLGAALRDGTLAEPDIPDAIAALERLGAERALAEVAAAAGPPAARRGAVAALGKRRSALLVELAGVGDRAQRAAVLGELAHLPARDLLAAARAAEAPRARGDLWRAAVRAAVHQGGDAPATLLAALSPELAGAPDYEQRYRLVTAIAELASRVGDPSKLSEFRTYLAGFAKTAPTEAAALRQAAAELVARHASAATAAAVLELAADPDPGVRQALLRALAEPAEAPARWTAEAHGAIDDALARALGGDRWPELRRAAATALGARCDRAAPATALSLSVDRDSDVDVRQEALLALVTCRAPGIAERLVSVWKSNAPTPLRARAVMLAVMLGDARLATELASALARWRSEAFSEESAVLLAMRAAEALGRLGGPAAAPALRAALADAAYPEIVAAAAAGLGALGPACPAEARDELVALTRAGERTVALAARRAAATCGRKAARSERGREP